MSARTFHVAFRGILRYLVFNYWSVFVNRAVSERPVVFSLISVPWFRRVAELSYLFRSK